MLHGLRIISDLCAHQKRNEPNMNSNRAVSSASELFATGVGHAGDVGRAGVSLAPPGTAGLRPRAIKKSEFLACAFGKFVKCLCRTFASVSGGHPQVSTAVAR